MARTKTFPAYRETTRAEKPLARLATTYGLGLLDYRMTANEVEALAAAYADGQSDAATAYSDSEATDLLSYTVASQAAAMYCDNVHDEDGHYGGLGLSRVALALVCYRWATGWVDGIKAIHAAVLAEDAAQGNGGAK